MTNTITKALFCMLFCAAALMAADKNVFDFTLNSIDGQPTSLASFKGKSRHAGKRCQPLRLHAAVFRA
jgi:hypothetical protein